jgi:hypothetical protein
MHSRRRVLEILQPSRIIPPILPPIAPPPRIPLLSQQLLPRPNNMTAPIIPITSLDILRHMALLQIIPKTDSEIENPLRDAALDTHGPGLAGLNAGHLIQRAEAGAGAVDLVRGLLPVVVDEAVLDDEVVGPALCAAGVVVDGVGADVGALAVDVGALAALVLGVVTGVEVGGGDWGGGCQCGQEGWEEGCWAEHVGLGRCNASLDWCAFFLG